MKTMTCRQLGGPCDHAHRGRWKNPIAGMGWYRKAKRDFSALSDE
jgi:hypothetical protein